MENYSHYFPDRDEHFRKLCRATACGHTVIPPGAPYPLPTSDYPQDHTLNWKTGRILEVHQFIYISSGSGTFESQSGGTFEVDAPCLLLLFPGDRHRYQPSAASGWVEDWIEFDGSLFREAPFAQTMTPKCPLAKLGDPYEVRAVFARAHHLALTRPSHYLEELGMLAMQLVLIHHRAMRETGTADRLADVIVRKAQARMNAHIGIPFQVGEFASTARVSESYFRKCFHQRTGLSPTQYWMRIRERQAEKWLQHTGKPITEIAEELGFDSIYHFSAWFKRRTSLAPSKWRKRNRQF